MKRLAILLLFFCLPAFAQIPVKEDTAIEVDFWFFDAALGTNETGLTVTSIVCRTVKNGVTTASFNPTASGGSNDMVELGHGGYRLELTASQLDTAGMFTCACSISGSVSAPVRLQVVPAASYAVNYEGDVATNDAVWEYAKASIGDTNGIGYWLKTNADVPTSQYSPIRNRTTIATLASQTSFTLTAGSSDNDAYNGWLIVVIDASTAEQMAAGVVEDYTGSTKTITLRTDPGVFTMATGDTVVLQPDRSLKPTVDNRTVDITATGASGVDWGNVEAPTTSVTLSGTTVGTVTTTTTATNLTNLPAITSNWLTAAGMADDASTEIATKLFATTYEGAHTFKHFLQYGSSALFGKYSASGSTFNFRDLGDTKNRIIYTTTATSRATVTLSPD